MQLMDIFKVTHAPCFEIKSSDGPSLPHRTQSELRELSRSGERGADRTSEKTINTPQIMLGYNINEEAD